MPEARPNPRRSPADDPMAPMTTASMRLPFNTWRRVAPRLRSRPTSRRRWAMTTENVFQMTTDPTTRATTANAMRIDVNTPRPSRTCSDPSAASCSPVSATAPAGSAAATARRSCSASVPATAATSTWSTTPSLPSTCCAVRRSKAAMVAPATVSLPPKPRMPTSRNCSVWSSNMTRTGSPTSKPASVAVRASSATSSRAPGRWPSRTVNPAARPGSWCRLAPRVGAPPGWMARPALSRTMAKPVTEPAAFSTPGTAATVSMTDCGRDGRWEEPSVLASARTATSTPWVRPP